MNQLPTVIKILGLATYFGGKGSSGTYQKLTDHARPHNLLATPFLGNCVLTRRTAYPVQVITNGSNPTTRPANS